MVLIGLYSSAGDGARRSFWNFYLATFVIGKTPEQIFEKCKGVKIRYVHMQFGTSIDTKLTNGFDFLSCINSERYAHHFGEDLVIHVFITKLSDVNLTDGWLMQHLLMIPPRVAVRVEFGSGDAILGVPTLDFIEAFRRKRRFLYANSVEERLKLLYNRE